MSEFLRIGIVSLGGAGRAHLRRFLKNPKAKVVAVFDPKPEAVQDLSRCGEDSLVVTTDLEEFYSCEDTQAVAICSPDHTHAEYALRALKRGWHVLCEKPLTTTLRHCERLVSKVQETGLKFMVHHQLRYLPIFRKAKQALLSKRLGKVFAVEADYFHFMKKRAVMFDEWRIDPDNCQNIVLGGGCHPIDLMQWIIGDKIVETFAYANHIGWEAYPDVDTVVALFTFLNGAIGKMTMTISPRRPIYHPLVIMGTEATIVNGLLLKEDGLKEMMHFPASNLRPSRRLLGKFVGGCHDIVQYPFDHNEHDLASQVLIDQFVNSVLSDTPVPITVEDSADAVRVCLAVIESYRTKKPVRVERP